jgi:FkbM family methyltransferase
MQPSNPDDQPFRHYSSKHHIAAWISQNLFDNFTYTVRHGLIKGSRRKGGLAWMPEMFAGSTHTPELEFWKNLDLRGQVVYDVGAFQGLLTLYFVRQARQVICYEPNTRNNSRLQENLRLNAVQNATVRKVGVGAKAEVATMVVSPLMPGGASVDNAMVQGLREASPDVVSENITIVTLDEDIREHNLPVPGFIKIDIEGQELAALEGARQTLLAHKPRLFLEMHGETMNLKRAKVAAIIDFLIQTGYTDIQHVESGTRLHAGNSAIAAEGHLYCQ